MTNREIVDRLTTRYMTVGSRMAAREAELVRKANEGIAKANNKTAQATVATLKAEEQLRVARAAARKDTMGLSAEMAAQQRTAQQLTGAFSVTQAALKRVAQLEDDLRKATAKSNSETDKQKKAFNVLRGALTEVNSGFELLKKGVNGARALIDGVVGKPLDLATGFETGLAKIRTLGVDTASGFEQDLLDLARRVPQTAGDITNAAFDAISAQPNKSLDEIVKLLDSASKVATGGSITLQDAVRGLTSTTNAYKASGLDAARSADVLFATMKQGVFTIDDLVRAQGSSLGVGAALKVQYEELGATVATLTAGGIPSASEAFTRLDSIMNLLAKPTKQQQKAFNELGISFGAADLQAKGFTNKLREIARVTGGSAEAISKLTGRNKEAFQALSVLISDGLEKYNDALNKITADAGSAQFAFNQLDNTVAGQLARLSAEFEGLLIQVGKALLPTIRGIIADLQDALAGDKGAALVETVKGIAEGLLQVAKYGARAVAGLSKMFSESLIGRQIKSRIEIEEAAAGIKRLAAEMAAAEKPGESFGGTLMAIGRELEKVPAKASKVVSEAVNLSDRMHGLALSVNAVAAGWGPLGTGAAAAAASLSKMADPTTIAAQGMEAMAVSTIRALQALALMPGAAAGATAAIRQTLKEMDAVRTKAPVRRRGRKRGGGGSRAGAAGPAFLDETALVAARAQYADFLGSIEGAALQTGAGLRESLTPLASSFNVLETSINGVGSAMATLGQNFIDALNAGSVLSDNVARLKEFGTAAASSLGMAAVQALWYGESVGDAVAAAAKSLSAQAGFEALASLARGFTALALSDPRAPGHFKAAGLWAATSAATGLAAAALGGGGGGGSSAGLGGTGTGIPTRSDFGPSSNVTNNSQAVNLTVNVETGLAVDNRESIANAILGVLPAASRTLGASRIPRRLVSRR